MRIGYVFFAVSDNGVLAVLWLDSCCETCTWLGVLGVEAKATGLAGGGEVSLDGEVVTRVAGVSITSCCCCTGVVGTTGDDAGVVPKLNVCLAAFGALGLNKLFGVLLAASFSLPASLFLNLCK